MQNDTGSIKKLDLKRIELEQRSKRFIPWFFLAPLFIALFVSFLSPPFIIPLLAAIMSIVAMALRYFYRITRPFKYLQGEFKDYVLHGFMTQYHPNIDFTYSPKKKLVKSIIKDVRLVSANVFNEEDVIQGSMGDAKFYLSEAHLQVATGKSTHTSFKGILMQIKIPDKNFPNSQIKTKANFLARMFNGFVKHERYGFHYESEDPDCFLEELDTLFPFIRHLMKEHKGLRIKTQGDTITLLLDTKMKFLDDPKPSLHKSFDNKKYYNNLGRQLNSLLFIVEAFVNGLNTTEIQETLELKMLEYQKMANKK